MSLGHWVPEVPAVFLKKSTLPSFLPCSSNSSGCFFVICVTFVLFCLRISSFSLRYYSIWCNKLWNSAGKMFSFWIACDIASVMLFHFFWTKNLVELCFLALEQIIGLIFEKQYFPEAVICSSQTEPCL